MTVNDQVQRTGKKDVEAFWRSYIDIRLDALEKKHEKSDKR